MSATADLLAFAVARHVLPDAVRADAIRLLGDTLAVGAASANAPGADAILSVARGWGPGSEARLLGSNPVLVELVEAPFWPSDRLKEKGNPLRMAGQASRSGPASTGSGRTAAGYLPAASAAFVNGYRVHCLEWDAVHEPAVVHAMSVVTAALGAVIDRTGGVEPEEALVALAVGVDIASGLGLSADSPLSFFRPATAGCIGAALACARFTGAPMADTLGLAYSSCAGTMQAHVEGSIALPFQIANAARAAVTAVDLAGAGFSGPHDALEGPFGYFKLFDRGDLGRYTRDLGQVWRISEISTKPFPSGRASHGVLGALQQLRHSRESGNPVAPLSPGDESGNWTPAFAGVTVEVLAHVPPLVHRLVGRPMTADMTPAYARLCLPLLVALMLRDGHIDPRAFTPETFADPAIQAQAAQVRVVVDDNADPNALSPQLVEVDGARIAIPATLGSPEAPLSPDQAAAKRALCRELASAQADPRLFDDPLGYFTQPRPVTPDLIRGPADPSVFQEESGIPGQARDDAGKAS